jgi:hypothetical protein
MSLSTCKEWTRQLQLIGNRVDRYMLRGQPCMIRREESEEAEVDRLAFREKRGVSAPVLRLR